MYTTLTHYSIRFTSVSLLGGDSSSIWQSLKNLDLSKAEAKSLCFGSLLIFKKAWKVNYLNKTRKFTTYLENVTY